MFVLAGWVEAAKVSDLDDAMLSKAIKAHAVVESSKYDLGAFELDVAKLIIENSDNCVTLSSKAWNMVLKYQKLLSKHGYTNFLAKQSKIAVLHILQVPPNATLRKRMALNLRLRKEELEADFTKFVRVCASEADAIERQEIARRAEDPRADVAAVFDERARKLPAKKDGKPKKQPDKKRTGGPKGQPPADKVTRKRAKPNCLKPKCDGQHFINDCPNTSEEEKKRLKKAYHEAKRASGSVSGGKREPSDLSLRLGRTPRFIPPFSQSPSALGPSRRSSWRTPDRACALFLLTSTTTCARPTLTSKSCPS